MSDHLIPSSLAGSALSGDPVLYLALCGLCLIVALRFLRRAVAPAEVVVGAVAAAAVVAFTVALALFFLVATAIRLA